MEKHIEINIYYHLDTGKLCLPILLYVLLIGSRSVILMQGSRVSSETAVSRDSVVYQGIMK